MNPGVAAGVTLIVAGMVGAVVAQFRTRNDTNKLSTGRRLYMLSLMTMLEVTSVIVVAIVIAHAKHALSIVIAAVWLAAWSYITASQWRRFIRDQGRPW